MGTRNGKERLETESAGSFHRDYTIEHGSVHLQLLCLYLQCLSLLNSETDSLFSSQSELGSIPFLPDGLKNLQKSASLFPPALLVSNCICQV